MTDIQVRFIRKSDDDVEGLAATIESVGAEVTVSEPADSESDLLAESVLLGIVVLGLGGTALSRIADWLRDRDDCLLVIDARRTPVLVEERCDIDGQRGRVVVVAGDGAQVSIVDPPKGVDLSPLYTARQSGGDVKAAAETLGLQVSSTAPHLAL